MLSGEGAVCSAGARVCPAYNAPGHAGAARVRAAVEATDASLQRAVAARAAGPNPVHPDPRLLPTPGMTWLERMQADDARLRAALDATDAALRL